MDDFNDENTVLDEPVDEPAIIELDDTTKSFDEPDVIKVSARSRSTAVAGAIAGVIRQHEYAEVQAIGAGAVNQAVKAIAIARGYLKEDGLDILCQPYFNEVEIDGQERTAVRFSVEQIRLSVDSDS